MIEKVTYIKGLADGLDLGDEKVEKVVRAMIDVMEEMADEIDALNEVIDVMAGQIDEVDQDLGELEEEFYGDDCDCDCDCDCDDDCFTVECPECGAEIEVDDEMFEEDFIFCPECNTKLEFAFDECNDDCCCGHEE